MNQILYRYHLWRKLSSLSSLFRVARCSTPFLPFCRSTSVLQVTGRWAPSSIWLYAVVLELPLLQRPAIPTLSDSTISDFIPTTTFTPTASPIFSSRPQPSSTPLAPAHIYIKVLDFGSLSLKNDVYLGADIPKANCVHWLNGKLGAPDRRASAALDPSSFVCCFCFGDENGRLIAAMLKNIGRAKVTDGKLVGGRRE